MAYIDPSNVVSPKDSVRGVRVIHNAGASEWAIAEIDWQYEDRVETEIGLRWNGSDDQPGVGNPQSRGHPTWFIVPEDFQDAVRARAEEIAKKTSEKVREGYRAMARDRERENEAEEWTEGLLGDAADSEG